jgi:hypothetical protein
MKAPIKKAKKYVAIPRIPDTKNKKSDLNLNGDPK